MNNIQCSVQFGLLTMLETRMNWPMQWPVSSSHSPAFHHTAEQINTTSRQPSSGRTVNGVFSSKSPNNLHLFWNTTMNHFNLSCLEIFLNFFFPMNSILPQPNMSILGAFESSSDEGFSNLLFWWVIVLSFSQKAVNLLRQSIALSVYLLLLLRVVEG